ncbi:hypothetical protein Q7C36_004117 [Tachysurus vachellii]|uniref:Uncharacterized protein n=1 Tax=Tachysurus vachellii TaxID=175792 RepID=A0AA88T2C9_TACVA|nr:hypothetical protein Q7C36_004117 [Tachysurus vachellii]
MASGGEPQVMFIHVREKSPHRKRGRSSSDGQLPPACNCRETVREALREFLPGAVEAALPAAGTPQPPDGDELMDIKTLETTNSVAQVFLGATMLGDIGHIAKEVRCGGSTVIIGFAAVAIALEVLLLLFLGIILWRTPRDQSKIKMMNYAFLACVTIHFFLRVVIIALVSAQHCQVQYEKNSNICLVML